MKQVKYENFESALEELEKRVSALEEGKLPLDEALKVFEEGMSIAEYCARKLQEAEQKVEILMQGPDGQLRKEPFPDADEDSGGANHSG
ncbi:MAG: exodeoxyribonuclease VII small subunit [Acidobacteria bacterium]|nr:exodeoxyribonuclease VII small subunit [Acidobacteriota bacterium]